MILKILILLLIFCFTKILNALWFLLYYHQKDYTLGVNATETEVRRRRGVTSVEPCGLQCFRHLTKEMVKFYLHLIKNSI